jgi:hypothetical protein
MEPRTWRILLPFTRPLTLNHRMHYMVKAKRTHEIREGSGEAVREAGVPPLRHLRAWIEYEPRDKRVRDPINLIPTLKACEDSLMDAGVVPNDDPRYVTSVMPKVLPPIRERAGRLWLVIEEVLEE